MLLRDGSARRQSAAAASAKRQRGLLGLRGPRQLLIHGRLFENRTSDGQKHFEHLFVRLVERRAVLLVDHLQHANHRQTMRAAARLSRAAELVCVLAIFIRTLGDRTLGSARTRRARRRRSKHGHDQHGLRVIPGAPISLLIEARVLVRVRNVDHLARARDGAGQPLGDREAQIDAALHRPQLARAPIDEEERGAVRVDQISGARNHGEDLRRDRDGRRRVAAVAMAAAALIQRVHNVEQRARLAAFGQRHVDHHGVAQRDAGLRAERAQNVAAARGRVDERMDRTKREKKEGQSVNSEKRYDTSVLVKWPHGHRSAVLKSQTHMNKTSKTDATKRVNNIHVCLGERGAATLVDALQHADDGLVLVAHLDGHCHNVARAEAGARVRVRVEARVRIGVGNENVHARLRAVTGDALSERQKYLRLALGHAHLTHEEQMTSVQISGDEKRDASFNSTFPFEPVTPCQRQISIHVFILHLLSLTCFPKTIPRARVASH